MSSKKSIDVQNYRRLNVTNVVIQFLSRLQFFYFILIITNIFIITLKAQNWEIITAKFSPETDYMWYADAIFLDENNGFIFESSPGRIWKTNNNGNNWTLQHESQNVHFYDAFFLEQNIGWVAGSNGLYQTLDGGEIWTLKPFNKRIYSVHFFDRDHGIIGVEGGIFETLDSAKSWGSVNVNIDGAINITKIKFVDDNIGYAMGYLSDEFHILKTNDGGKNWSGKAMLPHFTGNAYHLSESGEVILAGYAGIILLNTNLEVLKILEIGLINDLFFVDNTNIWLVGNDGLVLRINNQLEILDNYSFGNDHLFSVSISNDTGIIFGLSTTGAPLLYKFDLITSVKQKEFQNINSNPIELSTYPNPFNSQSTISFVLDDVSEVNLKLYSITGELIRTIGKGTYQKGNTSLTFKAGNLTSGLYLFVLEIMPHSILQKQVALKKVLLIK
ncbi:MAG: T9SS type A sorting domain-containing protein [Melioribacteraceae bacterium]|nr:T9SS type A sorting domain-containing protein [Melioribacteraceae bacterium]MCF8264793.1 T9SS type A sorting domain-containing protein [Melioribacteraceae bacterium]